MVKRPSSPNQPLVPRTPYPVYAVGYGEEIGQQDLPERPATTRSDGEPITKVRVVVTTMKSPDHLHIRLQELEGRLTKILNGLNEAFTYVAKDFEMPMNHILKNQYCAAKSNAWYRAKILAVFKETSTVELENIDTGEKHIVSFLECHYLPKSYADLPKQAFFSKIIGLKPIVGEQFPAETTKKLKDFLKTKDLMAHVWDACYITCSEQERKTGDKRRNLKLENLF